MHKALYIFFLGAVFLLAGCKDPLEKSVLEPLSSKELDKAAKRDVSFLETYSIAQEKGNYILTENDSVRWSPITYGRLHAFIRQSRESDQALGLSERLGHDWESRYTRNTLQADSLIAHWEEWLRRNSPDSIARISFMGIETERVRNAGKQIDTLLKFKLKIKAPKAPVDSLRAFYAFADSSAAPVYIFLHNGEMNDIRYRRKITDSAIIKVYPYLDPQMKKRVMSNDTTLVFKTAVHSVYSNGICYQSDSLKAEIPSAVCEFIERRPTLEPVAEEDLKGRIIRELIDSSFVSRAAYISIRTEEHFKQSDPLVFDYLAL